MSMVTLLFMLSTNGREFPSPLYLPSKDERNDISGMIYFYAYKYVLKLTLCGKSQFCNKIPIFMFQCILQSFTP